MEQNGKRIQIWSVLSVRKRGKKMKFKEAFRTENLLRILYKTENPRETKATKTVSWKVSRKFKFSLIISWWRDHWNLLKNSVSWNLWAKTEVSQETKNLKFRKNRMEYFVGNQKTETVSQRFFVEFFTSPKAIARLWSLKLVEQGECPLSEPFKPASQARPIFRRQLSPNECLAKPKRVSAGDKQLFLFRSSIFHICSHPNKHRGSKKERKVFQTRPLCGEIRSNHFFLASMNWFSLCHERIFFDSCFFYRIILLPPSSK